MDVVNLHDDEVNLYVPIDIEASIEKSDENPDADSWLIQGYATTPDLDLQDDIMLPTGIDISHLMTDGWINYEHRQGDAYKVGVPTKNTYVDIKKGLYLETKLYKENPYAKAMWDLANNIKKSGIPRKLGYSVEGYVVKRNADDPRVIEKVKITNVAITTNPANPEATWDVFAKSLAKSWTTGHAITPETQTGAAALRAEQLGQSLHSLASVYRDLKKSPIEFDMIMKAVGKYLDSMDRYTEENAVMFLQISKGVSRDDAVSILDKIKAKGQE